jgi:hypothetical protein
MCPFEGFNTVLNAGDIIFRSHTTDTAMDGDREGLELRSKSVTKCCGLIYAIIAHMGGSNRLAM